MRAMEVVWCGAFTVKNGGLKGVRRAPAQSGQDLCCVEHRKGLKCGLRAKAGVSAGWRDLMRNLMAPNLSPAG